MKTRTARKEATTAPLVRWQKPWNCMQMGTQLARRFPECARSTIAAAAAAAAVSSAAMICSKPRTMKELGTYSATDELISGVSSCVQCSV